MVIGLQSTGEARTLEALEEGGGELNDFVSTAKYELTADDVSHTRLNKRVTVIKCVFCHRGVLQSLIEKHFPAPDRQKLYSLLGIDLSAKKTPSPSDTAAEPEQKGKKRKGNDKLRNHEITDASCLSSHLQNRVLIRILMYISSIFL